MAAADGAGTVVRGAALAPVAWRNGAGTTRDIDAAQAAAGPGPLWRLSLATIDRAAPFSVFAGMDRYLAVVSGAVALTGAAPPFPAIARPGDAPLYFPGELSVAGEPVAGPALVLNLMTRRPDATATLHWRAAGSFEPKAPLVLVFARAAIIVSWPDQTAALEALDTLRLDGALAGPLHVDGPCLTAEVFI